VSCEKIILRIKAETPTCPVIADFLDEGIKKPTMNAALVAGKILQSFRFLFFEFKAGC